ncbi:dicarboxylate/amino acid:cation symporter [Endozoicomonas sp.]|uniref:dicarboxylate/amino acid:cation symporter n=1 Tax=Endozoicomonas sp. TaxID=1892382 RepID=UPI0028887D00|nr:dicarboxylate/amino acid:cation symporter [Endozoicomonas sp.]
MQQWSQLSLTAKVLIGMVIGLSLGLVMRYATPGNTLVELYLVNGIFHVVGQIFLSALKMIVVPLVFTSIVCGACSLKDISTLGRLGGKTIALYLFTTFIAISMAMGVALLVAPGAGANLESATQFAARTAPSISEVIIGMFPSNPFEAMASGNTLQIIVFALLFGIAIAAAGKPARPVVEMFQALNEVMMKLVTLIMNLAPYGVLSLMATLFYTMDLAAIGNLIQYFLVVAGVLVLQVLVTYCSLLKMTTGLSPKIFLTKMQDAIMFAFSTASSNATIPVTMEAVTRRMGVKNEIASFTIPLGSTINMDGTAIMQGVATVFIAQAFGVDLAINDYLMVIVTATLASIGTAGVPGVGLIMLAMVLQQVGLPLEGIALIMGVDRLLDMIRTAVNITGDSVVTCIVAKSENNIDLDVFNDIHAGDTEENIDFHHIVKEDQTVSA